jgi:hypothetical protein
MEAWSRSSILSCVSKPSKGIPETTEVHRADGLIVATAVSPTITGSWGALGED